MFCSLLLLPPLDFYILLNGLFPDTLRFVLPLGLDINIHPHESAKILMYMDFNAFDLF
jgi:hypothetical protein